MSEKPHHAVEAVEVIEGDLDGKLLRVRIVASKYNREIVDRLLEGALKALRDNGVRDKDVHIVRVPGAFEIPVVLRRVPFNVSSNSITCDAQIALGCVIRGETAHFDQVVNQCSRGVMNAMLALDMPIGFGVLAVDDIEQARARSGEVSNRGEEAALAVLETAKALRKIRAYRRWSRHE